MTTEPTAAASPPHVRRGLPAAMVVQLRPRQWIKNFACFGGLIFSGRLMETQHQIAAGVAFAAFCLASSAVYALNDLLDIEKDRANPRTARRPLASGDLPVWAGIVLLLACAAGAVGLSLKLGVTCVAAVGFYMALNTAYSLKLKQEVVADVLCIALGFVLRLLFGVWAVGATPTSWVVLCMFFLATFLGFAKRHSELEALAGGSTAVRPVLASYSLPYLDTLIAMSAAMTVMCYAVFTAASHKNPTLVITIVPVVYCVLRYMMQVLVRGRGGTPEDILLTDRKIWLGVAVWLALCVWILYWDVRLIAESDATR
jgi:4-hydroxybenzoate polyprenyltransferase